METDPLKSLLKALIHLILLTAVNHETTQSRGNDSSLAPILALMLLCVSQLGLLEQDRKWRHCKKNGNQPLVGALRVILLPMYESILYTACVLLFFY